MSDPITLQDIKDFDAITEEINRRMALMYPKKYSNDPAGFITDVLGETLTDDLRNICNSVRDNEVTIAKSGNGTGKSWISVRIALWFYVCQASPAVYMFAAPPRSNLENILWAGLLEIIAAYPHLTEDCTGRHLLIKRKDDKHAKEIIAGLTIPKEGTAAQKKASFSGKHAESQLFIGDEADAVPDPCFDGIETCQSGGLNRALYTFNPRARLGAIYRMIQERSCSVVTLSAFTHPSVIDGIDYFPGSVNRENTARRVAEWTRPLSDGELPDKLCYELPDYMVGVIPKNKKGVPYPALVAGWYKIENYQFSDVVLGEYPAQAANQLISEEWFDMARSRYDMFVAKHGVMVPEHIKCTAGVDIADDGEDSSVLTKRFGNFVHPQVKWNKQNVIEVGDSVRTDLIANNITSVAAIYCDGTGVGAGTAPYMARQYALPAVKVKVAEGATEKTEDGGEFGILRDMLMWKVREWLRTDLAMLPPDPYLREELLAFTYSTVKGKMKVSSTDAIKELLKRSPDHAMSLMFSFMTSGFFTDSDLS